MEDATGGQRPSMANQLAGRARRLMDLSNRFVLPTTLRRGASRRVHRCDEQVTRDQPSRFALRTGTWFRVVAVLGQANWAEGPGRPGLVRATLIWCRCLAAPALEDVGSRCEGRESVDPEPAVGRRRWRPASRFRRRSCSRWRLDRPRPARPVCGEQRAVTPCRPRTTERP
jgi:hypothetical protein